MFKTRTSFILYTFDMFFETKRKLCLIPFLKMEAYTMKMKLKFIRHKIEMPLMAKIQNLNLRFWNYIYFLSPMENI